MLEIAICDDDIFHAGFLEEEIYGLGKKNNVIINIDVFCDGKEIVNEIESGKQFDVIFMDIMMGEMSGLEAADRIRTLDRVVQLIYVTSYSSYMKDAFRSAPVGFLQKPVNKEELQKLFFHVLNMVGTMDYYYRFRYSKVDYKLAVKDILYCESHKRETEIVTEKQAYKIFQKLNIVEQQLLMQNAIFVRIHESFLVNYRHVLAFAYDSVLLSNGKKLPVSRGRVKEASRILRSILGG